MAFLPCDRGHINPRGTNTLVYSAYGRGSDFSRFRLRLCQTHAAIVWQNLAQFEVSADSDETELAPNNGVCVACLKPVDEVGWQVFATAYPTKNERKDYWAALHTDCRFPDWLINTGDNGHIPTRGEPKPKGY